MRTKSKRPGRSWEFARALALPLDTQEALRQQEEMAVLALLLIVIRHLILCDFEEVLVLRREVCIASSSACPTRSGRGQQRT